jgi:hypothetical protein
MNLKVTIEGSPSDVKSFLLGLNHKEGQIDLKTLFLDPPEEPFKTPPILVSKRDTLLVERERISKLKPPATGPNTLMSVTDFIKFAGITYDTPVKNQSWGFNCAEECRCEKIPYGFKTGKMRVNEYPFYVIRNKFFY